MDRAAPFTRIVAGVTPHFVTRQIFAGSGKVGTETGVHDGVSVDFQLSSGRSSSRSRWGWRRP